MAGMKIEVYEDEAKAREREDYFRQRGFQVQPPGEYEWVSWSNKVQGGQDDRAMDPSDDKVWIVIATK
jgi:hypothetical protein